MSKEFVYEVGASKSSGASGFASTQVFAMGITAFAVIGALAGGYLFGEVGGIAGCLLGIAGAAFGLRRRKNFMVIRVVDGELLLHAAPGKPAVLQIALADLDDVSLDTKTEQRLVDGPSMIPAMRVIDSEVGGELDITRIVFRCRGGEQYPLTEEHLSYSDTIESFGQLRSFLRKQGWVPAIER